MAGASSQVYSSPSSSSPSLFPRPDPTPLGCEICGAPKAGFWLIVRRKGQAVASIARACPSCANEAESSEDTTGASGRHASDAANREAAIPRSTENQALAALINSCREHGLDSEDTPAQSSLPEPFKTLLQGVYTTARDFVLGTRAAVAGLRDGRRL